MSIATGARATTLCVSADFKRAFLACPFGQIAGFGRHAQHYPTLRSNALGGWFRKVRRAHVGPVPRVGHYPFAAYLCPVPLCKLLPPGCAGWLASCCACNVGGEIP